MVVDIYCGGRAGVRAGGCVGEAPQKVAVNIGCNWDFNWFIIRILNSRIMGSFRSEPDVNKHTTTGGF